MAKSGATVKAIGDDAFLTRGMHGLDYVDLFVRKGNRTIKVPSAPTSVNCSVTYTVTQSVASPPVIALVTSGC